MIGFPSYNMLYCNISQKLCKVWRYHARRIFKLKQSFQKANPYKGLFPIKIARPLQKTIAPKQGSWEYFWRCDVYCRYMKSKLLNALNRSNVRNHFQRGVGEGCDTNVLLLTLIHLELLSIETKSFLRERNGFVNSLFPVRSLTATALLRFVD